MRFNRLVRLCDACQPEPGIEGPEWEGGCVPPDVACAIGQARRGGQPLEKAVREQMSFCLGHDFRDVRVHADSEGDELTRRLGATAFACGSHVFFQRGAYEPATGGGWLLIAHELAHVLQQRGASDAPAGGLRVSPAGDPSEREAGALARLAFLRRGAIASDGPPPMRPPAPRLQPRPLTVQRQVATFIRAADNLEHRLTDEGAGTRPLNCHEAVLGWLLTSLGYPRRWRLIRLAAARLFPHAQTPQFQGAWMWNNIYATRHWVNRFSVQTVQPGDILCSGVAGNVTHSMAVVSTAAGAGRTIVNIRGFNNIGTFGNLLPLPQVPAMANPPQYDDHDRDAADPAVWQTLAGFGVWGNMLFRVRYADAATHAETAFPWEHSPHPSNAHPRWHYNPVLGWRWY